MSTTSNGLMVVCTYRVTAGSETRFEALLARHTPTLRTLGLITETPPRVLRRNDGNDSLYVEVFEWSSPDAANRASEVPEVIAIWEPLAAACEERDGLPGLEFALFDRIDPEE